MAQETIENSAEKTGSAEIVNEAELPQKLQTLWQKAGKAMDVDNYDYVINLLQAVLKEEPGFLKGRKRLREAAVRKKEGSKKRFSISSGGLGSVKLQSTVKKDPEAAMVSIEKEILGADPYNAQGNQMLFEAATRMNMPKTAGFALETLVEGNPDNTKYKHQLGDFYMEQKLFEEASQVFGKIVEKDGTDLVAIQKSKNATAQASMAKQSYSGKLRDNLRDSEQAVQLEKGARAGMTAEQIEEQINLHLAEYAENQEDIETVKALASLYEQKEDFDNALQYYEWAHHLSQGDTSLEQKVIEVRDTQRIRKMREFEKWLKENEGHEDYDKVKADYDKYKSEHFQTQIDDYAEQVERNPTDNQLRFKYGKALYEAGKLKDAIPQLQRAQQAPSLRIKAMLLLGQCYEGRNMNDLAVDQLSKAVKELQVMDDTKKDVLYQLGVVNDKMGNKEEALECFKEIYQADYSYRDVADRVESSYD